MCLGLSVCLGQIYFIILYYLGTNGSELFVCGNGGRYFIYLVCKVLGERNVGELEREEKLI